jgi:Predicted metal-sulfur cluster biosynthetic enzyme
MINKIYDSLKEVYDPEIPLDIVNLGLVKAIDIKDNCINIVLMLTSPNCPLQDVIVLQLVSDLIFFYIPWVRNYLHSLLFLKKL